MNLFALHSDPILAAQLNNSKHTVKMCTELAQVLSTAHRVIDGTKLIGLSKSGRRCSTFDHYHVGLYKATHINHPTAIWVRSGILQYKWAVRHLDGLCKEYTYRYGKIHKVERDGLLQFLTDTIPTKLKEINFTLPTPAMPDYCIIKGDVVGSYRKYYNKEKQHLASWSGKVNSRPVPDWFIMTPTESNNE